MKYSFMSFSCPELSLDDMIDQAVKLGFDGIEPRINPNHKHGVDPSLDAAGRTAVKETMAKSPIEMCCVATSCKYADPAEYRGMIDDTAAAIDLAADVGCSRIRVFGGVIPDGISREKAIDQVAEALKSVAGQAEKRGVDVCMETHDHWCDPAHVAAVLKKVDSPAVVANWDIMHPVRIAKVSMDHAFETLKPWIRHLHIHDGQMMEDGGKMLPIGEGVVDHKRALELLATIDYDGFISGEWINWEPYDVHLPRELATLKRYESELGLK